MDGDDYWNTSHNKSFNFDDEYVEDEESIIALGTTSRNKLNDDSSEISSVSLQNEMPLHLIISDEDLQLILEEQMIIDDPGIKKSTTLEEEVKILRRKLNEISYCPIPVTITKLLMGKPCSLEIYRTLQEKEDLLDEAISCGSGGTILQVVMFLKSTLKSTLFFNILKTRKEAINHYINYLKTTMRITESCELLIMLGRHNEASMLQFQSVASNTNIELKKQKLKKIYTEYFSQPGSNTFYAQLVANYLNLLDMQTNERLYFLPDDVLDKSVVETLYYCCSRFKWKDNASNACTNPYKVMEQYAVQPGQFEWIALMERGKAQAWRDVEALFEKKAWHSFKQKSFTIHIPIEKVILQLHFLEAPQPILNSFLSHVEDLEKRLNLAKKVNATRQIIDTLVLQKDKNGLEEFKEGLVEGSEEKFYAENAISKLGSTSSWMNVMIKPSSSTSTT
ncbi:unnamed protein product [Diamesa serratosioi]